MILIYDCETKRWLTLLFQTPTLRHFAYRGKTWRVRCDSKLALLFCSILLHGIVSATAQTQSFPLPPISGLLGEKDPAAVAELTAYDRATSSSGWQDFQAAGTLTYPAGDSHAAELYLSGSNSARLDVTMNSGTRSLRIGKATGLFQDERGNEGSLSPATSRVGIVAFPRIWISALRSEDISLYDQGTYSKTGRPLHRITMEYPLASHHEHGPVPTVATDLYFDPATNLLLYSVDAVAFKESPGKIFTRTTQYSNYQPFNGVEIPSEIQQMLDDQPQWTLQLNQVNTNENPPDSTFSF